MNGVVMKERLDKYLANNNFASSRTKAKELIKSNSISVNGQIVTKASYAVKDHDKVEIIDGSSLKYVSRAGLKLEGAIDSFNLDFKDKNIMDIGSSTGGFTDCSLKYGARRVVAIDVGTDLMDGSLRNDERVELYEQLNFKNAPESLFENIDIIVSDVSFISLKHIIDRISAIENDFELVFLIKPQFECGKEIADKYKGLVMDREVHEDVLIDIRNYFKSYGYDLIDLDVSKIQGKSGNIEYLGHFKRNYGSVEINIDEILDRAFPDF